MNRRLLGNFLLAAIVILSISGVIMYLKPFNKTVASTHTFFGFIFVLAIVFHIVNNKKTLIGYIKGNKSIKFTKWQAPLIFAFVALLVVGLYFNVPGLRKVYNWGNEYRSNQIRKAGNDYKYQVITLDKSEGDSKLTIELKKGTAFKYPLFTVWAEDTLGNYLKTLYVSRVISTSDYSRGMGDEKIVRRPEAVPYWSHKRGVKASDGLFIPLQNNSDLDAVTGATPTSNFVINSHVNAISYKNFKILMEVNQSFDWNEYYSTDKFPDDKVYSGSGRVGQPSLIYEAVFKDETFVDEPIIKFMSLIGHGHHSGKNGELYKDLSNITTAKNIADRIIVTIN